MFEQVLRAACGLDPSRPVLAGVSGGPDSLCLLGILQEAGFPVVIGHFNHGLRPEADREAEVVSALAEELGFRCLAGASDVRAEAVSQSLSLEQAARAARYRFLFTAARQVGAQALAVGHTADDQVETVLMHLLRGSGLDGLKGMSYRVTLAAFDPAIPLVRPLLSLRRSETEAYCRKRGFPVQWDPSNADPAFLRNRVRHHLIPELERYNPRLRQAISRTAEALQGDYDLLQELLERTWKEVAVQAGDGWLSFQQAGLAALSPALRRNLLRRAGERLRPDGPGFDFEALTRVSDRAGVAASGQVDFACGLYLAVEGKLAYLAAYEADLPVASWPQVGGKIEMTGVECDLGSGWQLHAWQGLHEPGAPLTGDDPWSARLDADLAGDHLTVRPRRPGDRFLPLGLNGRTVRLQDFFVNVKLPRRARSAWPLVCAGEQILWVPGYRIAEPLRLTERTQRVLHLQIRKK